MTEPQNLVDESADKELIKQGQIHHLISKTRRVAITSIGAEISSVSQSMFHSSDKA
jgi:hypothetical protein